MLYYLIFSVYLQIFLFLYTKSRNKKCTTKCTNQKEYYINN